MAAFTVNTHHAYLNNDIVINADGLITIEDAVTGQTFEFENELRTHLSAGHHILKSADHEEEILIENAIKLGGGRIKKAYVFDDSAWVFMVMKDRTYIMNTETEEEKIEYNITPDDICSLGAYRGGENTFFLIRNSQDYSIYDISSGKLVITFSNHIYSNAHYVVYKEEEDVIIYDYRRNVIISEFQGQYSLGKKFYYIKDSKLYGLDLQSTKISIIESVGSVPNNSILHENTLLVIQGDYSKQKDTIYKSYAFYELGNGESNIIRTSLLFPYFIDNWFGVKTEEFQSVKEEYDAFIEKNKDILQKNISQVIYGLKFNKYEIRKLNDKKELVFKGELIRYPILGNLRPLFTIKCLLGYALTLKDWSFLICEEEKSAQNVTKGEAPNVPEDEELLAFSISQKRIITRKENSFYYHNLVNNSHLLIFEKTFDDSNYTNAYFASDGRNVVLQISKSEGQLLGINDLQTTLFEVDGFTIARNEGVNGYKPEIEILDGRKPVWRDPITLGIIPEEEMSIHIFKSPDGKYIAKTQMMTIYFNRLTKSEMTFEEIEELRQKYNWNSDTTEEEKETIIVLRRELAERSDRYDLFGKIIEANSQIFSDVENEEEREKKRSKVTKNDIERYITIERDFASLIIDKLSYVCYHKNEDGAKDKRILIGRSVYFLNYVSFSYDSKYLSFAAKMNTDEFRLSQEGVFEIYDLEKEQIINRVERYGNKQLLAVWMAVFSKRGDVAFYDSRANAYLISPKSNYTGVVEAAGKSLLCFSPSGKYIACSDQNYIDYKHHPHENWGHQPSGNVFIHAVKDFNNCLEQYNDLGEGVEGVAYRAGNVASAAFSQDETKLLVVGNDGVVVVRNLMHTNESERNEHERDISGYDDSDDYGSHYGEFAGSYAQDVMDYSDDVINDAFDGNPEAYWNID